MSRYINCQGGLELGWRGVRQPDWSFLLWFLPSIPYASVEEQALVFYHSAFEAFYFQMTHLFSSLLSTWGGLEEEVEISNTIGKAVFFAF